MYFYINLLAIYMMVNLLRYSIACTLHNDIRSPKFAKENTVTSFSHILCCSGTHSHDQMLDNASLFALNA